MIHRGVWMLVLGSGLLLSGCYSGHYMQRHARMERQRDSVVAMTNGDVITLTKSGVKEKVIISMVNHSVTAFQLSPADVIMLSDSGVTENVISTMIKVETEGSPADSAARRGSDYSQGYGYYPGYAISPWWYWGYSWDPWFYYPRASYGWYRPHSYGFRNYGFHNYGFHNYGFSGHSFAPRTGYSGGSYGGGGRAGGHRR